MSQGIEAERLFVDLCSKHFLRGFVFHSPRFRDPSEKEAGDVVLWVRLQVVVVEILTRVASGHLDTKQFVKRIGEKRDQLVRDYAAYHNPGIQIEMVNERDERVLFDKQDLAPISFSGLVIVDSEVDLRPMHYGTVDKCLALSFPLAIMRKDDFLDLTAEVDTIPDLVYYLHDRSEFVRAVFRSSPHIFLDLNRRLERNLMGFYKTHENRFPIAEWKPERALEYADYYHHSMHPRIKARDEENASSFVIDEIVQLLREANRPEDSTLLHAWELASLSRRQRAGMFSRKIIKAFEMLSNGRERRQFAFFNQVTECWSVFYFRYGGDRDTFINEAEQLTRYKLFVEMKERDFHFSVFSYAFRKSILATPDNTFDEVVLRIEDAADYTEVSEADYKAALKYFGRLEPQPISEFPI